MTYRVNINSIILNYIILIIYADSEDVAVSLSIVEEYYGSESITVLLEWTSQRSDTMYNIMVNPNPLVLVRFMESNITQIIVSYNTEYVVSVVTLCQHNPLNHSSIKLHYGEKFIT